MPVVQQPTIERPSQSIRKATIAEQKDIIASLVLGFHNDPAVRWLYPNPCQYLSYFPKFVQAFGGKAFTHGTVHCTDEYSGAALWYAPGVEPDSEPVIQLLQQTTPEASQPDIFAVFEQMDHYHPQFPHWYLTFIGVEPMYQRRGYGTALIRPVLEQCDRDRVPAYLESSNPANISFYQHHGFDVLGPVQSGDSPTIFPMLRRPR